MDPMPGQVFDSIPQLTEATFDKNLDMRGRDSFDELLIILLHQSPFMQSLSSTFT